MSDEQLSKLFHQLPDEDPPDTGMAALMAAARQKAAEMAPPPRKSLWARVLETLKAPPVLALATVVVLIGGAIVIKNHDATMDASNRVVAPASAPAPASSGTAGSGSAAAPAEPVVPPAPAPAPAPAVEAKPAVVAPRPAASKRAEVAKPAQQETAKADESAEASPPPPPPPPPPANTKAQAPPPGVTIATDADAEVAAAPQRAPVVAGAVAPQPTLVEQLLHACQAAAHKRDCPTARTLASQINTRDASFYRARVLKDADIVKCLE